MIIEIKLLLKLRSWGVKKHAKLQCTYTKHANELIHSLDTQIKARINHRGCTVGMKGFGPWGYLHIPYVLQGSFSGLIF